MAIGARRGMIGLAAAGAIVVAALAWAWIDGGEEPVRELSVPVPVPGAAR